MVRDSRDPGPWIPGIEQRFILAGENDPDQILIREQVQDGGRHLFVLHLPISLGGSPVKAVGVGFYPDELHSASWSLCDPRQKADWNMGRLVILKTLGLTGFFSANYGRDMKGYEPGDLDKPQEKWWFAPGDTGNVDVFLGDLNHLDIAEIKRNNRNARRDLKRQSTKSYLEKEIHNAWEEEENRKIANSDFVDAYVEAYQDTEHHVKGNPRVSLYTGRSNR